MEGKNNWLVCWKFADVIKLGAPENTNEDEEIIARKLAQKYVEKIMRLNFQSCKIINQQKHPAKWRYSIKNPNLNTVLEAALEAEKQTNMKSTIEVKKTCIR